MRLWHLAGIQPNQRQMRFWHLTGVNLRIYPLVGGVFNPAACHTRMLR